ncbi:protein NRT1/ PTR FAMILY 5.10, partial [Zea mays]
LPQSLGMLTASSMMPTAISSPSASPARLILFYVALYLLALAQGFYGPCGEAFGADQFTPSDDANPSAPAFRSSYFNWFHFSISWGYAIASAGLSYVQDNAGWTLGFGACWTAMLLCLAVFLLGTRTYRAKQPADGGTFAVTVRAWAARVFRRKDATPTERLVLTPQPEGGGLIVIAKLLPIWLTSLVFAAIFSQVSTLFTKQASILDRHLGTATGIVVPPAALQCLSNVTFIVMLPLYDRVIVPLARRLTGHASGITMLQRIGASMATSCVAMAVAALVEVRRLRVARDAGLVDRPDEAVPMSLWWMIPQYVLIGLAGVLGQVGLEEFFYDQVPDTLRSVGLALCLSIFGVGSYASSILVSVIDWATRRRGDSWFSDNLNRAHLDYFYGLLAGLAALEVAAFLHFANRYVYTKKEEL